MRTSIFLCQDLHLPGGNYTSISDLDQHSTPISLAETNESKEMFCITEEGSKDVFDESIRIHRKGERKDKEKKSHIEAVKPAAGTSYALVRAKITHFCYISLAECLLLPFAEQTSSVCQELDPMPAILEKANQSKGVFRISEEGSKVESEESAKPSSAPRCKRKALSGGVMEMVSSILDGSGRNLPAGSSRLSTAASQHLHVVDDSMPRNREKSLSDGVKFMKKAIDGVSNHSPMRSSQLQIVDKGKSRNRTKALSEGVKCMKNAADSSGCRPSTGSAGSSATASHHLLVANDVVDDRKPRNRNKALSDEVECMKKPVDGPGHRLSTPSERHARKERRRLQKTQSEGVVSMMRSSLPTEMVSSLDLEKERKSERLKTLSELSQMPTKVRPRSLNLGC